MGRPYRRGLKGLKGQTSAAKRQPGSQGRIRILLAFDTPNSATKLSGWDNELSEPRRTFIVPAKYEAAARHEKTRRVVTPIYKMDPVAADGETDLLWIRCGALW